ncbi:MAG: DUF697 domain-containing protein [Rhodospirillales bacterium]|jgi:uncharacterized protein (DUF697 family)|nr:DUF697 domain-containing protein [Rhodospirillales bacterium]
MPTRKKIENVDDAEVADVSVEERAAEVIRRNVLWSMGAGVIPVAYVDSAAILAVQVKLLKELSDLYGVRFQANVGKSAVAALIGTVATSGASYGLLTSGIMHGLLRSVPVVGQLVALATMPAFAAATTYAVGKVFDQHFASGGTFLTFDPKKVEGYFREKFEEAKKQAPTSAAA